MSRPPFHPLFSTTSYDRTVAYFTYSFEKIEIRSFVRSFVHSRERERERERKKRLLVQSLGGMKRDLATPGSSLPWQSVVHCFTDNDEFDSFSISLSLLFFFFLVSLAGVFDTRDDNEQRTKKLVESKTRVARAGKWAGWEPAERGDTGGRPATRAA